MRISSAAGMIAGIGLNCICPSLALAAHELSFGNTISIGATNASMTVFTVHLSGSASIHPRTNQVVIHYRTKVTAHCPRLDSSSFHFKIHLELLDQNNEVVHIISFNASERPHGDTMSFPIPESVINDVKNIRSSFHAV